MKRYLELALAFISISAKRYMENRVNTLGNVVVSIFTFLITIIFINVIFSFTGNLNGWRKEEVLLVLGAFKMMLSLFYAIFQRSINFLPIYIKDGDLDYMLTKPINTRFLVSFRLNKPFELFSIVAGMYLFCYELINLHYSFTSIELLLLLMNLVFGMMILYNFYFSIACLSFWLGNFNSLNNILYMLISPMQFPTNIYGQSLSFVITYIIPVGLVIMIPVRIFLDKAYYMDSVEIVFVLVTLYFSHWFWNYALKHYTSASS